MATKGMGTNTVTQIGLVVRDIDQKIDAMSQVFGMEKPEVIITAEETEAHTRYRGEPSKARAKLAFFNLGQVSLELIEPIGGPSTWKDFLDQKGEGVHHIAFQVKDTQDVVQFLGTHDIEEVQRGDYTGGMYTYVDSSDQLGVILELLENF